MRFTRRTAAAPPLETGNSAAAPPLETDTPAPAPPVEPDTPTPAPPVETAPPAPARAPAPAPAPAPTHIAQQPYGSGPIRKRRWPLQKRYVIPFLVVQHALIIYCALIGWGWFAASIINIEDSNNFNDYYGNDPDGYDQPVYNYGYGNYPLEAGIAGVNAVFATINFGFIFYEFIQFCRAKLSVRHYLVIRSIIGGLWIMMCIFSWYSFIGWSIISNVGSFIIAGIGEWIYALVLYKRHRYDEGIAETSTDGFGGYSAPPMMAAGQGSFVPGQYYYPYGQPGMMMPQAPMMTAPYTGGPQTVQSGNTTEFYAPAQPQQPPTEMVYGGYRYSLVNEKAAAHSSTYGHPVGTAISSDHAPQLPLTVPTASLREPSRDGGASDVSGIVDSNQTESQTREVV